MYVDAKSFKAGYSKAFLSNVRTLPTVTRIEVAKAYFAGMKPGEIAKEYDITVQRVISIAQWYDRRRYDERRKMIAQVEAPALVPDLEPLHEPITARDGVYVVEKHGVRVSLPYVSILGA